ncbi:unnamed protein product [Gadus morhua 'NCC']
MTQGGPETVPPPRTGEPPESLAKALVCQTPESAGALGVWSGTTSFGAPTGSVVGGRWSAVRGPRPPPPSDVWPVDGHAGGWDEEGWRAPSPRSPPPAPAAHTAAVGV